jgi:chitin deacetylase
MNFPLPILTFSSSYYAGCATTIKGYMSVRKLKLAKRKRLVRQILIFLSLVISGFCLAIALGGIARQPAAQTLQAKNSAPQISPATKTAPKAASTPIPTPQTPIADAQSEVPAEEQPVKTFSPPTQYQGKLVKQVKLSNKEKVVALTFDDGPWPNYTSQVLEILKKNDIKATFFWIGRMLKQHPEIAKQVVAEGHVVANHTWSHSYRWMNKATAAREIDDTADLIYKTTGVKSLYFRPPGGILTNGVADYAKKKNYAVIMWSNDSIDYRRSPAKRLVNNVMRRINPTEIVLMHDGGGNRSETVKALPEIISRFKKLGYKFVTIPELLEMELKEKEAASKSKKKAVNTEEKDSKSSPVNREEQGVKSDGKDSNSSPVNQEEQGVKSDGKDSNSSPINSVEQGVKSNQKDSNPSYIAPEPEALPAEGIQEIPDSQSPLPSPHSSTEQY